MPPELTREPNLAKVVAENAKSITHETGSLPSGTGTRKKLQLDTPQSEAMEDIVENLQKINGTVNKKAVIDDGKVEKADG